MTDKKRTHRVATSDDIEVSTYLEIAKELHGEKFASQEAVSPAKEAVAIIDFGSQYSHLIARRVRECHVYCELFSYDVTWEQLDDLQPKGFIFSGGPAGVYQENAPLAPINIYDTHLPILGICYGQQVLVHQSGGKVSPGMKREYGQAVLHITEGDSPLLIDLPQSLSVWMSNASPWI
jgi:GMP synthase (glutamine-hydrolysing)